jgi:hypothetical protein
MPDYKVNPQPWVKDAVRVADDKLVRQIAEDFRAYNPSPRSPLNQPPQTVQVQGAGRVVSGDDKPVASTGTGWASSPELRPPEGINLIDEMCAAEDASWRLQRAREVAEAVALKRAEEAFLKSKAQNEDNKPKSRK